MFTRNTIIILVLLLFLVTIFGYYMKTPTYKGRGYCGIDDTYIHPKVYTNFISEKEKKYIIETAEPSFRESKLVSGLISNIRKSETAWIKREDPIVKKIIQRVCKITNIPFENSEKMQVVKYKPNGYYKPHYDASCDDKKECVEFEKNGGQRLVTMLIYLNDDFRGGYTDFPNLKQKYTAKANQGLLFYSLQKDGNKCHPLSLHAGTEIEEGTKYIANIWLREGEYKDSA